MDMKIIIMGVVVLLEKAIVRENPRIKWDCWGEYKMTLLWFVVIGFI